MPIDQSKLSIDQFIQNPDLLQNQIETSKNQIGQRPNHYEADFNRYLNLQLLQLFQNIDQLDNVINHGLIMHTMQVYDKSIPLESPINYAFLDALERTISDHCFEPIIIIDRILDEPAKIFGSYFSFNMELLPDLDADDYELTNLNHRNLENLKALSHHPEKYNDNLMLSNFFKQLIQLRHLQRYLKRHLYRQWHQLSLDPIDPNWQHYFKTQFQTNAQHDIKMPIRDKKRYLATMELIDNSFSYHTGTLMTDW